MHIAFNTEDLTDRDLDVLRALVGTTTVTYDAATISSGGANLTVVPAKAETAEDAPSDDAKPKRTRRTKAQIAADEATAEGNVDVPSPDVDNAVDGEPTLEDAVAAASALLSSGQQDKVKAALDSVGAPRVSEVAPENIAAFIDALSA